MTAVLDGMTPLAFVRGESNITSASLAPEDWVVLIDDALKDVSFGDIGRMKPIGEVLRAMPNLFGCRQEVSPSILTKGEIDTPPGTRFLDCGTFSNRPLTKARHLSKNLLLGKKEFEPDAKRVWHLFELEVIWGQTLTMFERGLVVARSVALHALSEPEILKLFGERDSTSDNPFYGDLWLGRGVLHHLWMALGDTIRDTENRMKRVHARQQDIADVLGRMGYGPFKKLRQVRQLTA